MDVSGKKSFNTVDSKGVRTFLFIAFLLTGATGLIYQVIWSRLLVLSFGYTIHSISVVITAFMGGLAIGSLLGGFIADRTKNSVLVYGFAELGVGFIALLTYPYIKGLPFLIASMRESFSIPFYGFSPWVMVIAIALLLPPTILMGMTLPLLARALTRVKERAAVDLGSLYSLNTLGAATGSLVTGFFLIAFLGVYATLLVAAIINISIGIVAVIIGRRGSFGSTVESFVDDEKPQERAQTGGKSSVLKSILFWGFALSGFLALAAEMIWIRLFAPYLENSTYAFALILAIFLFGISAGGWAARKWAFKAKNSALGFGICQALAGLSTGLGLLLIFLFIGHYNKLLPKLGLLIVQPSIILEQSLWIFIILVPSTFFMGAGFPFIAQWAGKEFASLGGRTGKLYAGNTVGSIIGALAGGFLLLPTLGTKNSILLILLLYLVNGIIIIYLNRNALRLRSLVFALVIVTLFIGAGVSTLLPDPNIYAITSANKGSDVLVYREDPDVNVTLLASKKNSENRGLHINLRNISGTGLHLTPWMLHLPLLLMQEQRPDPDRLMIIGLGIGHTFTLALDHYPGLNVEVVELVPSVADIFAEFNPDGKKAIANKKGRIIIADGRNYLLSTKKPYDVVLIDPTPPLYGTGAVNLYTADFFNIVKERLNPTGILLLRVPYSADMYSLKLLLRTAMDVFPYVSLWKPPFRGAGFSLVASSTSYTEGDKEVRERLSKVSNLNEKWMNILYRTEPVLLGRGISLLGDPDKFKVVTDDRPYLEFPLFNK